MMVTRMAMSIEEMKAVDHAQLQLEQFAVQLANKEASMKMEAAKTALVEFKTYFANRSFSLSGSDWGVTATHGSIKFTIAIRNAAIGGIECLVLTFPDMARRPPLSVFLEARTSDGNNQVAAPDPSKNLLDELQDKIIAIREKLAEPPKRWVYYTLTGQRNDYTSFIRLLDIECP